MAETARRGIISVLLRDGPAFGRGFRLSYEMSYRLGIDMDGYGCTMWA
jgi:hypothetical protein